MAFFAIKGNKMSKLETIKKNYEFNNVLSRGNSYFGKQIEIIFKKNNLAKNKIGIAISTKAGKAVQRNRVKRLIRESYRNIEKNLAKGYSIVFLWNKRVKIEEASFATIYQDMDTIFKKMKLIKKGEE